MSGHKRKDIAGQVFGKLTVDDFAYTNKWGLAMWYCSCSCGGQAVASGSDLRRGHSKSCGCDWFNGINVMAIKALKAKRDRDRMMLVRAFFTTGLYPLGPPKKPCRS